MNYKGYTARIEFDEDDEILHGEVMGLRDVIYFEGNSVAEIRKSFHAAVDDYLDYCQSRGEEPDKPYSGKMLVRIDPSLHRGVALNAEREGESINAWVRRALASALRAAGQEIKSGRAVVPSAARRFASRKRPDR